MSLSWPQLDDRSDRAERMLESRLGGHGKTLR
jgi:hypothetical protein